MTVENIEVYEKTQQKSVNDIILDIFLLLLILHTLFSVSPIPHDPASTNSNCVLYIFTIYSLLNSPFYIL